MRYTIEYSRTIQVNPYEPIRIGLIQDFDENTPREEAWREVYTWVEKKIQERIKALTAKR